MTHTKDNIALVDVPEGAAMTGLAYKGDAEWILCLVKRREHWLPLPPGPWEYICLSTEMTEEKAREVVELTEARLIYDDFGGTDYLYVYKDYTGAGECYNPIQSFRSLLTALGCDPAGTYAVCVKNESIPTIS